MTSRDFKSQCSGNALAKPHLGGALIPACTRHGWWLDGETKTKRLAKMLQSRSRTRPHNQARSRSQFAQAAARSLAQGRGLSRRQWALAQVAGSRARPRALAQTVGSRAGSGLSRQTAGSRAGNFFPLVEPVGGFPAREASLLICWR